MTRFISLVWDDGDVESVRCASNARQRVMESRGWQISTDGAGLAVFFHQTRGCQTPTPLHHEAGVVVGTLFDRSTDASHAAEHESTIGEQQSTDILRSHGKSLVESHWGSYILFLRRVPERTVSVFRAPAGVLPCYYRTRHRCTLLASSAADLLWLCSDPLSINWDCIRAQAAAGDYLTRETGLSEVAATISGECLDIHEGKITRRLYWHPCRLSASPVRCFSEAVTLLQSETYRCVGAWAALHDAVLLLLSGGLDSSIVLSCLRAASSRTRVTAVNFHSEGPGDERRFARGMAERTGTVLEEMHSDPNIDLRRCLTCALTPSPVLNFSAFDVEPVIQRLARRWDATAIFTGETGDDVFGHAPAPEALAEVLQKRYSIRGFITTSMDFAELTRISVWLAMRLARQYRRWLHGIGTWSVYHHRRLAGHSNDNYLISQDAADIYERMIPRFTHPWFQDADTMPFGKAMLIYSFIKATASGCHSPFSALGEALTSSPLVSQPLLEAALRIPSEMHFSRGENGAVARAAFRSVLSPAVLNRGIGKGSPAMWARNLIEQNTAFLKELLLDGLLIHHGILDKTKIQTLLSRDISRTRVGIADLMRQVYIEAWLRRWAQAGAHT
jgi:asparagine synthase (glutamine-hydrolysing)